MDSGLNGETTERINYQEMQEMYEDAKRYQIDVVLHQLYSEPPRMENLGDKILMKMIAQDPKVIHDAAKDVLFDIIESTFDKKEFKFQNLVDKVRVLGEIVKADQEAGEPILIRAAAAADNSDTSAAVYTEVEEEDGAASKKSKIICITCSRAFELPIYFCYKCKTPYCSMHCYVEGRMAHKASKGDCMLMKHINAIDKYNHKDRGVCDAAAADDDADDGLSIEL
jgi:hypothetical protein